MNSLTRSTSLSVLDVDRKLAEIRGGAAAHVVLEVGEGVSKEVVVTGFRNLMKMYHPDLCTALIAAVPGVEVHLAEICRGLTAARRALCSDEGRPPAPAPDPANGVARGRRRAGAAGRPRPGKSGEKRANQWYAEGIERLLAGGVRSAADHFSEAVRMAPTEAEYHRALAEALSRIDGCGAEAISALEESVRLDAGAEQAWLLLGELRERAGLRVEARQAYEQVLALAPDSMRARLGLARLESTVEPTPRHPGFFERMRRLAFGG